MERVRAHRKTKIPDSDLSEIIAFRLTPELKAALDAFVEMQPRYMGGTADIYRYLILQGLQAAQSGANSAGAALPGEVINDPNKKTP